MNSMSQRAAREFHVSCRVPESTLILPAVSTFWNSTFTPDKLKCTFVILFSVSSVTTYQ